MIREFAATASLLKQTERVRCAEEDTYAILSDVHIGENK